MDLARAVDPVDQHPGTEGQEPADGHRVGDPAEVPEGLLAEPPVALLVEPVERESQKRDERKGDVVHEVGPEPVKRVRRLWGQLREQDEASDQSHGKRKEVGRDHQPVATAGPPKPWYGA